MEGLPLIKTTTVPFLTPDTHFVIFKCTYINNSYAKRIFFVLHELFSLELEIYYLYLKIVTCNITGNF